MRGGRGQGQRQHKLHTIHDAFAGSTHKKTGWLGGREKEKGSEAGREWGGGGGTRRQRAHNVAHSDTFPAIAAQAALLNQFTI